MSFDDIKTDIYSGYEITNAQLNSGDYPAIKCGDINSEFNYSFNDCVSFVNPLLIKKKKYFEKNDILLSDLSHTNNLIGKAIAYLGEDKCIAGSCVIVVKHNQNPKYLAYALNTNSSRKNIESLSQPSTIFRLYVSGALKIKIPLPPLEEQNRIAEQLDKFNELCCDVTKGIPELITMVQKQQEYYKNKIFEI